MDDGRASHLSRYGPGQSNDSTHGASCARDRGDFFGRERAPVKADIPDEALIDAPERGVGVISDSERL